MTISKETYNYLSEESKTKQKELKELKAKWGLDDHPYYDETIYKMEDFLLGK